MRINSNIFEYFFIFNWKCTVLRESDSSFSFSVRFTNFSTLFRYFRSLCKCSSAFGTFFSVFVGDITMFFNIFVADVGQVFRETRTWTYTLRVHFIYILVVVVSIRIDSIQLVDVQHVGVLLPITFLIRNLTRSEHVVFDDPDSVLHV